MGCPVKKVCNVASGSALLRHEDLIVRILDAVVAACAPLGVPVTLKTRTGWDRESRNALRVARLAENAGIAALTLHGRTRADLYTGHAEYDTIRAVRAELKIPLIANGDIDSPEKAKHVLDYTGADAVMIGRAAQAVPGSSAKSTTTCARAKNSPRPPMGKCASCCSNTSTTTTASMASTPAYARRASISAGIWKACRTRTRSATA